MPCERGRLHAEKTALIIGASRGIGAAAAQTLAAEGANVVLASRDKAALDALAASIEQAGGRALSLFVDLADHTSLSHAVEQTVCAYGKLDIAVNNGGLRQPRAPFHEMPATSIDDNIAINLRSVFAAMQAEIRAMLKSGSGSIVNIGSVASVRGASELPAYSAAKHGLLGLTRSLALEYAGRNIRINMVAPGAITTTMLQEGAGATAEGRSALEKAIPMGRIGTSQEAANAISWISSDRAAYVTGAVIPVDGGMSL